MDAEMPSRDFGNVPTMRISMDELQVIQSALSGYSGYLLSAGKLSSAQRQRLARMQDVQKKLTHLLRQAQSAVSLADELTFDDMEVASDAVAGFLHATSRRVPRSAQRDAILLNLRVLWQRLEKWLDEMATDLHE